MPTPAYPYRDGQEDLAPDFALSAWKPEDGDDIDLVIHVPENPSATKLASLPLIYGLAVMTLEQQGVIARQMNLLQIAGPVTEAAACEAIALILQEETNDQPV